MIKQLHKKYNVIIISSSSDFAFEGFGISAIDYLKKTIEFEKFDKAVQKALQNIQLQENLADSRKNISFNKDYLLIKEDQGILKVNYSDIIYITAFENYVKIITKHKTHVILTTLSQFERSINNHPFLRVHRSYLINLNHVKIYKKVDNDIEIPIGEMYKNDIQDIFLEGKIIKR